MENYTGGPELAASLGISNSLNMSISGSCNSRIIRTTLKDSYCNVPTLYIVGLTFLTRYELPIGDADDNEGKWVSITGQGIANKALDNIHFDSRTLGEFDRYWNKSTLFSMPDLLVDLQFRLLSLIDSLQARGHKIIVFNTAESVYSYFIDESRFDYLRQTKHVVNGLSWRSIPWQLEQGAKYVTNDENLPFEYRHVAPGQHQWLNEFLTNYITEYKILE